MISCNLIVAVLVCVCTAIAADAQTTPTAPGVEQALSTPATGARHAPAQRVVGDTASLALLRGRIVLDSTIPVLALQFSLRGVDVESVVLEPGDALNGFQIGQRYDGGQLRVVVYSIDGRTIDTGRRVLFTVNPSVDLRIGDTVLSDRSGAMIPTAVTGPPPSSTSPVDLSHYPNPFNSSVVLRFHLSAAGPASISVFDMIGRRVWAWSTVEFARGRHEVAWDGRDGTGRPVAPGVYVARIQAGSQRVARKMLLLR